MAELTLLKEAEELTELTEQDLLVIRDVHDRSLESHPDIPGVVTFQGPEACDLFKDALPADRIRAWRETCPELGQTALVQVKSGADRPNGEPVRHKRMFERLFAGSPRYPDGVPVGVRLRSTKSSDDTFKVDNSIFDINPEDRQRVRAVAYGTRYLTTLERREDTKRKDAARRMSDSPDAAGLVKAFQSMLTATGMAAAEKAVPEAMAAEKPSGKPAKGSL